MSNHVKLASGKHCHVRTPSTSGCAFVYFTVFIEYSTQYPYFKTRMPGSEHKSSSEVAGTAKKHQTPRKDEERQEWKEVPEEPERLTAQEVASWLSLFEGYCQFLTEKAMAPHSSTLAWKTPRTEEPGGLQSMGSQRVRYDWATSLSLSTFMHQRRQWHPTPGFSPAESQGRRGLVGCRLWGRTESAATGAT